MLFVERSSRYFRRPGVPPTAPDTERLCKKLFFILVEPSGVERTVHEIGDGHILGKFSISKNGNFLAYAGRDGEIIVFSIPEAKVIATYVGGWGKRFPPKIQWAEGENLDQLLLVCTDGALEVFRLEKGKQ